MRNIIIVTIIFALFNISNVLGQCNSTPDDLGLVTVTGGPSGIVTVTANSPLTYNVGLFGTLMLEVPVSTTAASISGASAVGLSFVQFFTSEDIGQPAGKKYAFFASAQTIDPITLFPDGVPVEIGTVSVEPAANISESKIVLTDLIPPVNNGGTYLYYKTSVQVCNMNNFNDNLIADAANAPLPIELSNFIATKFEKSSGKLNWTTASEKNGSHFEVERSSDAKHWSKIGTVEAKGESFEEEAYEYIDRNVARSGSNSIYYYRLKMMDMDGHFAYSEIRSISFEAFEGKINIFPNPTYSTITIDITPDSIVDENEETTVTLRGINGKILLKTKIAATGMSEINLDDLPSGIHLLEIDNGNEVSYHKIQKLK